MTTNKLRRFTSIATNFKGPDSTLELLPIMAIAGRGKSGKTRWRDAFTAALTGAHPARAHASQLLTALGGPGCKEVYSIVSAEYGGRAELRVHVKDGVTRNIDGWLRDLKEEDIARAFPASSAGAIFEYGKQRMRRVLFQRWGDMKVVTEPPGLDELEKSVWREGAESTKASVEEDGVIDPVDHLTAMSSWFASQKKAANASAGQADEDALAEVGEAAGSEMIPTLENELATAKKVALRAPLERHIKQLENQIEAWKTQWAEAKAEVERASARQGEPQSAPSGDAGPAPAIPADVVKLRAEIEDAEARIAFSKKLLGIVEQRVAQKNQKCPCCEQSADVEAISRKGRGVVEVRNQAVAQMRKKIADVEANYNADMAVYRVKETTSRAAADRARAARESSTRDAEFRRGQASTLEVSLENAERQLTEKCNELASLGPALSAASTAGLGTVETLEAELERLRQSKVASDVAQSKRSDLRASLRRSTVCKLLEEECTKALDRGIKKLIKTAETEINVFAPEDTRVVLDSKSYAWNTIGEDGRPHDKWAMCGTERASCVLSMASAWSMPLGVLWIDDEELKGLDPEVMRAQFARLEAAVENGTLAQIIVLTLRPHELPRHWPVHFVEELKQEAVA